MTIEFRPDTHSYVTIGDESRKWTSVTTLIGRFSEPFNAPLMADRCSKKKGSKWYGMSPDEIIAIWDRENKRSTDLGSWYHDQRENDVLDCKTLNIDGSDLPIFRSEYVNGKKVSPSQELTDGVYPEHLMYLDSCGVCGQSDLVKVQNGIVSILDYKGLPLDTEILTSCGFKKMEDLMVGDIVYDGNGKQTKITHVSDIHYNPCIEIKFDTNDSIICDNEHRWIISKYKTKSKYIDFECTAETLFNRFNNGEKLLIKCAGYLDNSNIKLPLDPYILGIWLGDGNTGDGVITKPNQKLWDEIQNRGWDISNNYCKKGSITRRLYGLRSCLKSLGLLNNKHIPDVYYNSSYEQRLDLLRGIMDTDGYYHKTRNRFVVNTTNEQFANDICNLVSSLGWKCTKIYSYAYCTNSTNKRKVDAYQVTFITDGTSPFLIRNNINYNFSNCQLLRAKYLRIIDVKYVNTVKTKCITVDSDEHTYLATRNFIKTHNSCKKIDTESVKGKGGRKIKMLPPVSHLDDCNLNHYALQLSMYMYMVLKHNPTLKPGKLTIQHVLFEIAQEDRFGYPIMRLNEMGEPIVKDVVNYDCPYMRNEIENIIKYMKLKKW